MFRIKLLSSPQIRDWNPELSLYGFHQDSCPSASGFIVVFDVNDEAKFSSIDALQNPDALSDRKYFLKQRGLDLDWNRHFVICHECS